jgi:hypothetical protein
VRHAGSVQQRRVGVGVVCLEDQDVHALEPGEGGGDARGRAFDVRPQPVTGLGRRVQRGKGRITARSAVDADEFDEVVPELDVGVAGPDRAVRGVRERREHRRRDVEPHPPVGRDRLRSLPHHMADVMQPVTRHAGNR